MLGYVRPYAPELRLRDYQYYKGVYCGLCRAMGRCTGQCSRLTLSYDLVFLALIRLALTNGNSRGARQDCPVHFEKRRCIVHPLRPRPSLEPGDATDFAACASALLSYYKILDDCSDEKGASRVRASLLSPAMRRFYRRALKRYPTLDEELRPHMNDLTELERAKCPSVDEPAEAFGAALSTVFQHGLSEKPAQIASHIGRHIGRWLYLVDAIDDYEQDIKKGRPNALYRLYGEEILSEQHRQDLENALARELKLATDALDLVSVDEQLCGKELLPLLYHMLQTALPNAAWRVLNPQNDQNKKRKRATSHDGSL